MKRILSILFLVFILSGCSMYGQSTTVNRTNQNAQTQNNPTNATNSANQVDQVQNIAIKDFAFDPGVLTIKKGKTVSWTNEDGAPHKIVSDAGTNPADSTQFSSNNLSQGESYSYTFQETGDFKYHCQIHPSMKGKIIVE